MFSSLRTRFGIPGVISVIALVFAMFGGAYAASNSSGGGKATASAKAKQGPRGKTGKTGPAGPAGPAGAAGAKGDAGAPGANGANGKDGAGGAAGASVTNTAIPTSSATCAHLGGTEFKVGAGTPTTACNGAKGAPGPTCNENGECLLPSGATETGNWAVSSIGTVLTFTSISYPLRLSAEPTFHYVDVIEQSNHEVLECPGEYADPQAEAGHLCVYEKLGHGLEFPGEVAVGTDPTSGLTIQFFREHPETEMYAAGSWAVTAP